MWPVVANITAAERCLWPLHCAHTRAERPSLKTAVARICAAYALAALRAGWSVLTCQPESPLGLACILRKGRPGVTECAPRHDCRLRRHCAARAVTTFMAGRHHTAQGGALLGRLWLMARFGCCVQVFNDYVAEVTVVRALCFTVSRFYGGV
jgi:hypothetical protein